MSDFSFFKIYSLYFKCDYFAYVGICVPCGILGALGGQKRTFALITRVIVCELLYGYWELTPGSLQEK